MGTGPLAKRIWLTNAVAYFGSAIFLASLPWDLATAPRWMIAEDLLGAVIYLSFPLLNRRGHTTAAQVGVITLSNLIVLANAVALTHDSGAHLVLIALISLPFALFDLRQRGWQAYSIALSLGCLLLAESGLLAGVVAVTPGFIPSAYYPYSIVVAIAGLLFSLYQTSRANADAEDALRRSREEYRLVTEHALDAVLMINGAGEVVFANPAACTVFGYGPAGELIGKPLATLLENVPARASFVEIRAVRQDGTAFPAEVSMGESAGPGDAGLRTAIVRDISERVRAATELDATRQKAFHAARLAALGQMSGGIAHEVNNPLSAIALRAGQLRHHASTGRLEATKVGEAATHIEAIVTRIQKIIGSLRSFARDGDSDPTTSEPVAAIVQTTMELCSPRFQQGGVALELEPMAGEPKIDCRAVQVSQVLVNLLNNAFDAARAADKPCWVRLAVEHDATAVHLIVTDSGKRIPDSVRGHLMEPFFTTKPFGEGTGLGLSVSKGLAESNGGTLRYDPSGDHTRFVLTLQRTRDPDAS
jgi:PAS domain S-box-containing protein